MVHHLRTETDVFFSPKNENFPYDTVYAPLNTARNDEDDTRELFRMVHILPGSDEDEIECTLEIGKLGGPIPYEALSYCAGSHDDCEAIKLNGHLFNTFRSAFEALRRFRVSDRERLFWIDQICINQTDIMERDSQVLLMGDIYKSAIRTHIWLGEAVLTPSTHLGYDLLNDFLQETRVMLHEHIQRIGSSEPINMGTGNILTNHQPPIFTGDPLQDHMHAAAGWFEHYSHGVDVILDERLRLAFDEPGLNQAYQWFKRNAAALNNMDSWYSLFELFRRPWWMRCWIVQEAVASRELHLVCGSNSIVWEDVSLFFDTHLIVRRISSRLDTNEPISTDDESNYSLDRCRDIQHSIDAIRRSPYPPTLVSHLRLHRARLASDPRDKVYSILGMLSKGERRALDMKPTYGSTNGANDVYYAVSKFVLGQYNQVQLLSEGNGADSNSDLPSWVPDFSKPRLATPAFFGRYQAGTSRFTKLLIHNDERMLQLHGWPVDTVASVGRLDRTADMGRRVLSDWKSTFLRSTGKISIDNQALHEFYRTIAFDEWVSTMSPSEHPERYTAYWLESIEVWFGDSARPSIGCRFFTTKLGRIGMATRNVRVGDELFIPWGSRMPITVRKYGRTNHQLVGPCYLSGMMDNEILIELWQMTVKDQDIYLV